jgi:SAM-dependent methyltransferase
VCNRTGLEFVARNLTTDVVAGRRVLEVGSYDVNGSARAAVLAAGARSYLGVDVVPGPGVDEICGVEHLASRFGPGSFDVVISTEMLEHIADWRTAIENLKGVLAENGLLVLTTRSPGFAFHGYPLDFWRFTIEDMRRIFADMRIEKLESDAPETPGVFLSARRIAGAAPVRLGDVNVYSVVRRRIAKRATSLDRRAAFLIGHSRNAVAKVAPVPLKRLVRRIIAAFSRTTKSVS